MRIEGISAVAWAIPASVPPVNATPAQIIASPKIFIGLMHFLPLMLTLPRRHSANSHPFVAAKRGGFGHPNVRSGSILLI
jgi:hypothetical protein